MCKIENQIDRVERMAKTSSNVSGFALANVRIGWCVLECLRSFDRAVNSSVFFLDGVQISRNEIKSSVEAHSL